MSMKQIVTFELKLGHTPVELLARLAPDQEKIISILNTYKSKFDEMVIINTDGQLTFYIYTNNYLPLNQLLESHEIAPEHFKLLENSEESVRHFYDLVGRLGSTIKEEKKLLKCLRKAYETAESVGSLGDVLKPLLRNGIKTYQLIRKESVLGKISMTLVSRALDVFGRLFAKKSMLTMASSNEMNNTENIERHR